MIKTEDGREELFLLKASLLLDAGGKTEQVEKMKTISYLNAAIKEAENRPENAVYRDYFNNLQKLEKEIIENKEESWANR